MRVRKIGPGKRSHGGSRRDSGLQARSTKPKQATAPYAPAGRRYRMDLRDPAKEKLAPMKEMRKTPRKRKHTKS